MFLGLSRSVLTCGPAGLTQEGHGHLPAFAQSDGPPAVPRSSQEDPLQAQESREKAEGCQAGGGERQEQQAEASAQVEVSDEADARQRVAIDLQRGEKISFRLPALPHFRNRPRQPSDR